MADLTPELLAQLEGDIETVGRHESASRAALEAASKPVKPFLYEAMARMLNAVPGLVAAAKERDQLREAARLREHATIEAWSGSATGLDAAALATAQAEALEELRVRIVAPTAEQQRDAAFAKVAALIGERVQLRYEVAGLSEQLAESQLARIALSEELDQLRATIERIKAFVADNALVNDFELEAILKGETP